MYCRSFECFKKIFIKSNTIHKTVLLNIMGVCQMSTKAHFCTSDSNYFYYYLLSTWSVILIIYTIFVLACKIDPFSKVREKLSSCISVCSCKSDFVNIWPVPEQYSFINSKNLIYSLPIIKYCVPFYYLY